MNDQEEQYRLQQLADLGSFRRDGISTEEDEHRFQPEEKHGSGKPLEQPKGRDNHRVFLNAWSSLHSTVGDTKEELDSLMRGQSHRAKLKGELHPDGDDNRDPSPQERRAHHQQHSHHQHHRNFKHGKPPLRMGYKPVHKSVSSKPPYAPYHRPPPPTVRPPLTARASPATKPPPAVKLSPATKPALTVQKLPTPKAATASKPPSTPGPSPALKERPAPGPQQASNQGRRKTELTGYNLPQPQTSSAAFRPQRHTEEDLLTFDSPPSRSSRQQSPVKVYQSASMSDLMEIDDGDMLTSITTMGGLQPSKLDPSYAASPKKPQARGLMASKYAILDDKPATEAPVGKAKATEVKYQSSSGSEIDFWQETLPRAVKEIIIKAKAEPSAKKNPTPLSKSRWAD